MIPYRGWTRVDVDFAPAFGMEEKAGREFATKEVIKDLIAYERERNQRGDWIFGR